MWSDVADIKKEFGLDESLSESDVRIALRKVLITVHPDATKGKFADEAQREKFERIISALEFLKTDLTSTDLIVFSSRDLARIVEQQNALVQATNKNQELILSTIAKQHEANLATENAKRTDELTKSTRASLRQQSIRKHRPFTISGASAAAIAAFLLAFKGPLEELGKSSVLGSSSYGPLFITLILVYIGLFGAAFAFVSNVRENRETERREFILSEGGFKQFLFSKQLLDALDYMYDKMNRLRGFL
jgi:hypothetical protein